MASEIWASLVVNELRILILRRKWRRNFVCTIKWRHIWCTKETNLCSKKMAHLFVRIKNNKPYKVNTLVAHKMAPLLVVIELDQEKWRR